MSWMFGLYRTPPLYIDRGQGASFTDVDGNDYLDFNLCDLSMTIGYGNESVAAALGRQAKRGAHYLLPTEDAIAVSKILAERMGLPFWQFTLSASGSNTEVIRIARFMTKRSRIVIFGGHYHGHIEETLVREESGRSVPETDGLSPGSAAHTAIVPFNDLQALERTLAAGDVAVVLTEPVMTNCNLVMPDPDFHRGVRELTRRYGALLCIDEAHTFQLAFGGLSNAWRMDADFIELGHQKFNINCAVCHGITGNGNGAVKKYMSPIRDLTDAYTSAKTEGEIFTTITYGHGKMGPYGDRITPVERWAIVSYVRSLQLAGNATPDNVPPAERAKLGL